MDLVTLDYETFYSNDVGFKKLTTEEYVRHPEFHVIGVGAKVNDGKTQWFSGTHDEVKDYLTKLTDWDNAALLCHNTMFDGCVLAWHFGIKPKLYLDTLCMARALHGVEAGGSLKALAERYNLGVKGTEVENAIGKKRTDFTPEDLARYGEYCMNDVDLTLDLFRELGPLAFASRLRRLSERIMNDINKVFRDNKYDFQARWSPILYLLKDESPLSVSVITERLGMTHPYVIRLVREMTNHKILLSTADANDGRRRLLRLSARGKRLIPKLEEHWRKAAICQRQLVEVCEVDILKAITMIEDDLDKEGMYDRLTALNEQNNH